VRGGLVAVGVVMATAMTATLLSSGGGEPSPGDRDAMAAANVSCSGVAVAEEFENCVVGAFARTRRRHVDDRFYVKNPGAADQQRVIVLVRASEG
jgi:hypothetical protein